jgi:hypothetical protein
VLSCRASEIRVPDRRRGGRAASRRSTDRSHNADHDAEHAYAAAWTLAPGERRSPRALAAVGLAGWAATALSLPVTPVVAGAAVLLAGAATYGVRARRLRA